MQVLQEVRTLGGKLTRLQDQVTQLAQKQDGIIKALAEQAKESFAISKVNFQASDNN